uniref:DUF112 domain-containing protein n=1 Tax=Batrachochytrium dendrobatidis (strain JAM81 / FGSC 10211) TaxID=684364 RepID=F4PG39_BATDJ|eukprot:XP_006683572.1 hypothetical protein BATDEDRAFT_29060 [Batrachochytrium dendrobatidis JAM81]
MVIFLEREFLGSGFATAFQWHNLLFALAGVVIGTSVGVLPGIGPMSGVALLVPITTSVTGSLSPEEAATASIIMLAGVYYGAMYGGSATSILINTPGEAASVSQQLMVTKWRRKERREKHLPFLQLDRL